MIPRAAAVVAAWVAAVAPARGAEPLVIHVAWTAVPAQMSPVIFAEKALLAHWGRSYLVEHVHFANSAPMLRAIAANEIDVAPLSPASFAVAIENAGLEDLRIIADGYQDGVGRHYSNAYMVPSDAPIRSIRDLKNKVVAINARGTLGDIALHAMLARRDLEEGRDYRIVVTQLQSMGAMLEDHRVDLALLTAPFAERLTGRHTARPLFDMRAAIGPSQSLVLVARAEFLARNRAALDDFFEDYLRGLRWFLDPAHHDAAVKAVAQFNRERNPALAGYVFTASDYYRDRDARPDLALLQKNLRLLSRAGVVASNIDVRRYADLSLITTAAARLK